MTDLDKAITIDPNYVQGLKLRADTYYASKQYAVALRDYQKVVAVDSQNAEAIAYVGLCYGWLGNFNMACQSYRRASDLGYKVAFEYVKQSCQ